jgi:transposase InsO family protein
MNLRDLKVFKKLGLTGYIEYMSIHKILPHIPILPNLSLSAKKKLKWMDHYRQSENVTLTCRYFGISRKTFHKWFKRYNPNNLISLEEQSRRPKILRQWQVSRQEELDIKALRKKYIRYGKEKLKVIYQRLHGQPISSWKIQRVIEKHQLYFSPANNYRLQSRKKKYLAKKRITDLIKEPRAGFLVALDTIVVNCYGRQRYILTGIDVYSKIAFARMYPGHGSAYAADFLKRMHYLLEAKIENIQTDNGSEFAKYFRLATQTLRLDHYHSRPKTPKDNAFDERFNRTLQDEFIALGHLTDDCVLFNKELTEWLVEYNFHRPHQTLGYATPIDFHYQYHKVLPMYPASTTY